MAYSLSLFSSEFFFFSIVLFIPFHTAYRERDDIELIPRSFNSETPRQRDTFKHIEAGSCTRSPFALSPPFHIYLGLLHYGWERGKRKGWGTLLFLLFPFLSFLGIIGHQRISAITVLFEMNTQIGSRWREKIYELG